ncbi:MAG TPA: hypothetical protein VE547_06760 [Mycobacteriales bacterium]|nr:hypothetical protein [Mycobacteriales bacterium]
MRRIAATTVVLTGALLVGCAQDGEPSTGAASPTATSAAPTSAAPAADAAALAGQIERATTDRPTLRVALDTKVSGAGAQGRVRMQGAIRTGSAGQAEMDLKTTTTESGKTEAGRLVVLDGVFYVQQGDEEVAPGKSWLRMSRADLAALDDAQLKAAMQQVFDQMDQSVRDASPAQNLALVEQGRFTATPKPDTVQGKAVTRYEGSTEVGALAGEEQYEQLRELGVTRLPWTIWVDPDGLPTQFGMTLPLRTAKGTVRTVSSAVYSDWGKPVTIQAPPAAQVATFADLGG